MLTQRFRALNGRLNTVRAPVITAFSASVLRRGVESSGVRLDGPYTRPGHDQMYQGTAHAVRCEAPNDAASQPSDGRSDSTRLVGSGHGSVLVVGSVKLLVRSTPGHTDGCITLVLSNLSMGFTGDALLIRGAGRTDFQMGNARKLFKSVREQILSLPAECTLYPGHDYNGRTSTTVEEERAHNPRLGDGKREQDFVGYMENLGLPHPRKMKDAVPANLNCGRPGGGNTAPAVPDWGPVIRTFAGVLEIDPEWVHNNRDELVLVDVREREELSASPLGNIDGSIEIPLSILRDRLPDVPKTRPVITVCPAGARSAQAALILEKAGFTQVANLTGGLLRWQALGFPI